MYTTQIKNIIILVNKVILDNQNNMNLIQKDINTLINEFNNFKNNFSNNNITSNQTKIYNTGKYIGMEMEYIIIIMVIDMKEIGEMIKKKEKEYIILIAVIDMKEILEMIK